MLHASSAITALLSFYAVLIGLVMGSFLNCLAIRFTRGETLKGRSHCFSCGHVLSGADLVPLFSYLFLKGRCRYCHAKIPVRYPLIEGVSALLFLSLLFRFDVSLELLQYSLLLSVLLCASLADLDACIIPDPLIITGIICRAFLLFFSDAPGKEALSALLGGLSVSLPLLLVVLIFQKVKKKEAMGGGDIKLFFVIGLYFSVKVNVFILLVSCLLGILFAYIGGRGKEKMIPFGPAISCAAWIAMLVGERAVNAYLSLF